MDEKKSDANVPIRERVDKLAASMGLEVWTKPGEVRIVTEKGTLLAGKGEAINMREAYCWLRGRVSLCLDSN